MLHSAMLKLQKEVSFKSMCSRNVEELSDILVFIIRFQVSFSLIGGK